MLQDGGSKAGSTQATPSNNERLTYALDPAAAVWRAMQDEVVVLELTSKIYLTLNGSGRLLWLRLAEGATVPALEDVLVATYGIDQERASADVAAFLGALVARSLLTVTEEAAPAGAD